MERAPRKAGASKIIPAEERFTGSKSSKKKLRREAFLLKIEQAAAATRLKAEAEEEAERKKKEDMSIDSLTKSLPMFDWGDDNEDDNLDDEPGGKKGKKKKQQQKGKKKLSAASTMEQLEAVQCHPSFQAAPLDALEEHLTNCFEAKIFE